MARVDEPSATAARQILGLETVVYADSGVKDPKVHMLLHSFYSMAQLTPYVAIPDAVAARVMDRLATGVEEEEEKLIEVPEADHHADDADDPGPGLDGLTAGAVNRRTPGLTLTLVMLIAALLLSLGANFLLSRSAPFRPEIAIHLTGTGSSPGARGVLLYDGRQVVLHASGLAELANGYRYVAWSAAKVKPRYLGSLTMLSGHSARLLTSADRVAPVVVVTIEPSASPTTPSGPQILVGTTVE